eukprot:3436792-Pyramimonas_sp.AAC.1
MLHHSQLFSGAFHSSRGKSKTATCECSAISTSVSAENDGGGQSDFGTSQMSTPGCQPSTGPTHSLRVPSHAVSSFSSETSTMGRDGCRYDAFRNLGVHPEHLPHPRYDDECRI